MCTIQLKFSVYAISVSELDPIFIKKFKFSFMKKPFKFTRQFTIFICNV